MPTPREYNVPGAFFAGILGVLLIAASSPLVYLWWGEDDEDGLSVSRFNVAWDKAPVGTAQRATLSAVGTQNADVTITDSLVAGVRLKLTCSDTVPTGGNPAVFTARAFLGNEEIGEAKTGSCTSLNGQTWDEETDPSPKLEETSASNQTNAEQGIADETAAQKKDTTFKIQIQIARPAGVGGLGGIGGSASATLEGTGLVWQGSAIEPPPEVVR